MITITIDNKNYDEKYIHDTIEHELIHYFESTNDCISYSDDNKEHEWQSDDPYNELMEEYYTDTSETTAYFNDLKRSLDETPVAKEFIQKMDLNKKTEYKKLEKMLNENGCYGADSIVAFLFHVHNKKPKTLKSIFNNMEQNTDCPFG